MKTRGFGPFTQDFYSVCSTHREEQDGCSRCAIGTWKYRIVQKVEDQLFLMSPRLWRVWANRPAGRARVEHLVRQIRGEV